MTQSLQQPFTSVTNLIPGMGGGAGSAGPTSRSSSPYPTPSATASSTVPPSQKQAGHSKNDVIPC